MHWLNLENVVDDGLRRISMTVIRMRAKNLVMIRMLMFHDAMAVIEPMISEVNVQAGNGEVREKVGVNSCN